MDWELTEARLVVTVFPVLLGLHGNHSALIMSQDANGNISLNKWYCFLKHGKVNIVGYLYAKYGYSFIHSAEFLWDVIPVILLALSSTPLSATLHVKFLHTVLFILNTHYVRKVISCPIYSLTFYRGKERDS